MSIHLKKTVYSSETKTFAADKLDVHRRVFPGGAQITTANNQSLIIKLLEYKTWIAADNCT